MARLEDIFNECYERILQGESFESCLRRYPEHAAELEPMLRTALGFTWRASTVQPRPEFRYWARVRLQQAQLHARQPKQVQKPGLFSWQRAWAMALVAILVILLTGGGTVAASADALPDQPLYPVKLATERIRLAFAFSESQKAEIYTQLALTRAEEIEAMAREGKTEAVVITAERLASQLEQASQTIADVESTIAAVIPAKMTPPTPPPAPPVPDAPRPPVLAPASPAVAAEDITAAEETRPMKESLQKSASRSLAVLQDVLEKAPAQAKPALQRAIEKISEKGFKELQREPGGQDQKKDKGKEEKKGGESEGNGDVEPVLIESQGSKPRQKQHQDKNDSGPTSVPSQSNNLSQSGTATSASPKQNQPASQNAGNARNRTAPAPRQSSDSWLSSRFQKNSNNAATLDRDEPQ